MRYRRDDLSSLGGSFNLSPLPCRIANRLAPNVSLSSSGRCSRCDRRTDQGFGISHSQLIASTKSSSRFFAIFVSVYLLSWSLTAFAQADSTFELTDQTRRRPLQLTLFPLLSLSLHLQRNSNRPLLPKLSLRLPSLTTLPCPNTKPSVGSDKKSGSKKGNRRREIGTTRHTFEMRRKCELGRSMLRRR